MVADLLINDNIEYVADWIELYVNYNKKNLSKSTIRRLTEESLGDCDEGFIDSILGELETRENYYGKNKPFRLNDGKVIYLNKFNNDLIYRMCLILSMFGIEKRGDSITQSFEIISGNVVKNYIDGDLIIAGFPNNKSLNELLVDFCSQSFEIKGNREPFKTDKDRGVDLICWKSFDDCRSNQIVLLIQCAAGKNWDNKKPVPTITWNNYINFHFHPIVGFTVPHIIKKNNWNNRGEEYGILFDRGRICQYYSHGNTEVESEIDIWCNNYLNTEKE